MANFRIGDKEVLSGTKLYTRLHVAELLSGGELALPLHVIHGAQPGPVLGLIALIHGVEYLPIRMLANALDEINPQELRGTVLALPVANPLALANRTRNTPERDSDISNLNRVFPGGAGEKEYGSHRLPTDMGITERIAHTIVTQFLPHVSVLLDFHHTQEPRCNRVAMYRDSGTEVGRSSYELARGLGTGIVQRLGASIHPGNLAGTAESMGIVSSLVEIGGGYLGRPVEDTVIRIGTQAIRNTLGLQGMMAYEPVLPKRQLHVTSRVTVRPSRPGYFVSSVEAESLFGNSGAADFHVEKGETLGVVLDPYTLEVTEELISPVSGYPVVIRRSGPCDAGDRGIAIAPDDTIGWVE